MVGAYLGQMLSFQLISTLQSRMTAPSMNVSATALLAQSFALSNNPSISSAYQFFGLSSSACSRMRNSIRGETKMDDGYRHVLWSLIYGRQALYGTDSKQATQRDSCGSKICRVTSLETFIGPTHSTRTVRRSSFTQTMRRRTWSAMAPATKGYLSFSMTQVKMKQAMAALTKAMMATMTTFAIGESCHLLGISE